MNQEEYREWDEKHDHPDEKLDRQKDCDEDTPDAFPEKPQEHITLEERVNSVVQAAKALKSQLYQNESDKEREIAIVKYALQASIKSCLVSIGRIATAVEIKTAFPEIKKILWDYFD